MKLSEFTADKFILKVLNQIDTIVKQYHELLEIKSIYCERCIGGPYWNSRIAIKISDWRIQRKWKIHLDLGAKSAMVYYNKRLVAESDDLNKIIEAIIQDFQALSKKYDERTINAGAKKSNFAPVLISLIREEMFNNKIECYSGSSGMNRITFFYSKTKVDIFVENIKINIYLAIDNIFRIYSNLDFDLSHPDFNPEQFVKTIINKVLDSEKIVKNCEKHIIIAWTNHLKNNKTIKDAVNES